MESIYLAGRLTFLLAVAALILSILLWKKFKRESWVIEEFEYHPYSVEDAPDTLLYLSGALLNHAYFPRSVCYFPEAFIRDGDVDEAEVTRKRVFDPVDLAEYQEFLEKRRMHKHDEEKDPRRD
jgi:hypothetical protein